MPWEFIFGHGKSLLKKSGYPGIGNASKANNIARQRDVLMSCCQIVIVVIRAAWFWSNQVSCTSEHELLNVFHKMFVFWCDTYCILCVLCRLRCTEEPINVLHLTDLSASTDSFLVTWFHTDTHTHRHTDTQCDSWGDVMCSNVVHWIMSHVIDCWLQCECKYSLYSHVTNACNVTKNI